MKLNLCIPFKTRLDIHPAMILANRLAEDHVQKAEKQLFAPGGKLAGIAQLRHELDQTIQCDALGYQDVNTDTQTFSDCTHKVTLLALDDVQPAQSHQAFALTLESLEVRIFHSGIAEAIANLRLTGQPPADLDQALELTDLIEKESETLSIKLARYCEDTVITPLASVLHQEIGQSDDNVRVQPLTLGKDGGQALWAARVLVLEEDETSAEFRHMGETWLRPFASHRDIETLWRADRGYFFYWSRHAVNLTILNRRGKTAARDCMEALYVNCFLWAVSEQLEKALLILLGKLDSGSDINNDRILHAAHRSIHDVRNRTEYTFLLNDHINRHMARGKQIVGQEILEGWRFEENKRTIQDAIRKSRETSNHILRERSELGNVLTDVILLFISAVAVFDFTLNLTQFGRSLASDATLGLRNEGWLGFVTVIANLPTDITVGGLLLIAIMGLVFYYLQRRRRVS